MAAGTAGARGGEDGDVRPPRARTLPPRDAPAPRVAGRRGGGGARGGAGGRPTSSDEKEGGASEENASASEAEGGGAAGDDAAKATRWVERGVGYLRLLLPKKAAEDGTPRSGGRAS